MQLVNELDSFIFNNPALNSALITDPLPVIYYMSENVHLIISILELTVFELIIIKLFVFVNL
jgi:hypothetical protein